MILIQAILIISFVILVAVFIKRQNSHQFNAWSKILMLLFAIVAVYVIIFPNSSNDIAHFVGVTRGADLLLYMLTLSFLFVVLNSYITRKREQQRIVLLARKIALLESEIKRTNGHKTS